MNTGGVIKGGLLAGLVIDVGETILNGFVVAEPWAEVMAEMGIGGSGAAIAYYVVAGFVIGILAVWLYAAARPRLGAGPAAAVQIGLVVWLLAFAWPALGMMAEGMFPAGLLLVSLLWSLVEVPLAVVAGAWVYGEAEG